MPTTVNFFLLLVVQPWSEHYSPLQAISSWMTANLSTLNTSKTEFLLIGLKQQRAEINSSLHTVHSACSLDFIFVEHLTSLISNQLFLNRASHMFINFAASVYISISKQPAPLLPPLFTTSLTTATHRFSTKLSSTCPKFSCLCCRQSSTLISLLLSNLTPA